MQLKYFDHIFQSLDNFQSYNYKQTFNIIDTDIGQEAALVKEWSGTNYHLHHQLHVNDSCDSLYVNRLQFWISNKGWAGIYGTTETFLIVGNFVGHPFVRTPEFTFCNSDGSTNCCCKNS